MSGFLDNLKNKLGPAKEKVNDLASRNQDKIQDGIDKAARKVDERTKGKYADKIERGSGKAKETAARMAEPRPGQHGHGTGHATGMTGEEGPGPVRRPESGEGGTTPPSSPPPGR
ncbi:antitoxin [Streptomyces sp. NPDC002734]|uniref:antitoxin n=1 Tax=Streptomyces sp. NPDC002734 TaxID=3154426 RepID=UPI00332D9400